MTATASVPPMDATGARGVRLSHLTRTYGAVRALDEGLSGVMVSLSFPNVVYVPLSEVAGRMKGVPMDSDTLQTARDLGICCGD